VPHDKRGIIMKFTEEYMNLFDNTNDYALVQCLSADFAYGGARAGIAAEFNRRFNTKAYLSEKYPDFYADWTANGKTHGCVVADRDYIVLNLITKERYFNKPTLETMRGALEDMKVECLLRNINKIAMPKIGCGLDKLAWNDVKKCISDTFFDTNIKIKVCFY
jgi:hypothetical protein